MRTTAIFVQVVAGHLAEELTRVRGVWIFFCPHVNDIYLDLTAAGRG